MKFQLHDLRRVTGSVSVLADIRFVFGPQLKIETKSVESMLAKLCPGKAPPPMIPPEGFPKPFVACLEHEIKRDPNKCKYPI